MRWARQTNIRNKILTYRYYQMNKQTERDRMKERDRQTDKHKKQNIDIQIFSDE